MVQLDYQLREALVLFPEKVELLLLEHGLCDGLGSPVPKGLLVQYTHAGHDGLIQVGHEHLIGEEVLLGSDQGAKQLTQFLLQRGRLGRTQCRELLVFHVQDLYQVDLEDFLEGVPTGKSCAILCQLVFDLRN